MIVRRAILPLGLLALLSCQLVAASDDDDEGLDGLKNGQGQTPCEMADGIKECGASRRARGLTSRPRATDSSNCTCTNVYFNLWSACRVMNSQGAPTADQYTSQCEEDGFQITTASFDGYDIPFWAHAAMPAGNSTFNVQQALDVSGEKDRWTKFQIITVVAVICSLVVIVAIFVFLYRWRQVWARQHGIRPPLRTLRLPRMPSANSVWSRSSRHKVQPSNDDDFEIDHDVDDIEDDYEIIGNANTARSLSGHIRLPSSPVPPRRHAAEPSFFPSIGPTFHRLARTIPIPWKTRPRGLKPMSGDAIFDIDDGPHPDSRYRSDSTLQNYRNPLRANYAPKVPSSNRTRSEPVIEEELNSDVDSEDEVRPAHFDSGHERERLITNVYPSRESPADVMLISRSGQNFTIESGETPTSSHGQHSQEIPRPPQRASKSRSSRPRVPPAPQSPAPVPPTSSPRSPARLRQASDDSMKGFGGLAPSHATPASPRHPVTRMASNDNMLGLSGVHHSASASSNTLPTAPSSSNPNLHIDPPSPLYIRRPSTDALRHQYQSPSNFGVPQTERISGYSTDLEIPSISSPPYHPSPLRDERILVPLRNESPYTPPPPLTPRLEQEYTSRHSRNVSSESVVPARGDPVMLFSGPVRAAGYMRSSSQTRS